MNERSPFVALPPGRQNLPLVVVDIGYSRARASCGLCHEAESGNHRFGVAVQRTAAALHELAVAGTRPVLVLEAPLSQCHTATGNPEPRGEFEVGREWYYGAGASTALGAQRFLREIAAMLEPQYLPLGVAEAFLSNKPGRTRHEQDARLIWDRFWQLAPEPLHTRCESLSPLVVGVPPVRVFSAGPEMHTQKPGE